MANNESSSQDESFIKVVFDYLQIFLRYFASGIIYFIIIFSIDEQYVVTHSELFKNNSVLIILLIGAVGLLNYAIHIAIFDRLFFGIAFKFYKRNYKIPLKALKEIDAYNKNVRIVKKNRNWQDRFTNPSYIDVYFFLSSQTYLRHLSKSDTTVNNLQSHFEKRLSLLSFLYCSIYPAIILPIVFAVNRCIKFLPKAQDPSIAFIVFVLIVGLLTLYITIDFDYRIVKREFWIIEKYFQKCSFGYSAQQQYLRKPGGRR